MSANRPIPRSAPEEQGVSASRILAFLDAAEAGKVELHSFMFLRHGHVIAEGWWSPYASERPHMLFSLSKSFASTAIGLAVSEGRLTVDDRVISFFPEYVAGKTEPHPAAMRIRDLLTMSTGHAQDATRHLRERADGDWIRGFFEAPLDHPPGTVFVYNSAATYMMSAIIQRATGQTLLEYLTPRLFAPLCITDATWETCPRGINAGGWGLKLRTEDIARFGQLYLQKGIWDGKRILPESWVDEATAKQISNGDGGESDWKQGYGYQFWRCRYGVYRGDGAFGQFCVVMPDQDAVIAITSGVRSLQGVLDLIWEHLLPGMASAPLKPDAAAQKALGQRLAALELPWPRGRGSSPIAGNVSGKRFAVDPNPRGIHSVFFDFAQDRCTVVLRDDRADHRISCGIGNPVEGDSDLLGPAWRVLAGGTWRDAETFVMTWRFVETPFCYTVDCRFQGDELHVEFTGNVAFGPKENRLRGRLAAELDGSE